MSTPLRYGAAALALLAVSSSLVAASPKVELKRKVPAALYQRSAVGGASAELPLSAEERATILRQMLGGDASAASAARPDPDEVSALAAIARTAKWREASGTPRQLRLEPLNVSTASVRLHDAEEMAARAHEAVRRTRTILGIDDPGSELTVERIERDHAGSIVRFSQRYQGIPVWPSNITVHFDTTGRATLIDGAFARTPRRVVTTPSLRAGHARTIAARALRASDRATSAAELIVFTPDLRLPRLAYRVTAEKSAAQRWSVIVDAHTGSVLERYDLVQTGNVVGSGIDMLGIRRTLNVWQSGTDFFLVDTSKSMYDPSSTPPQVDKTRGGIIVLDGRNASINDSTPFYFVTATSSTGWTDPSAVSLAWGLSQSYDYYFQRFGRRSYDDKRTTMLSISRYDRDLLNAFWNGVILAFGTGERFTASLDIVAHEMTHAVTSSTANLIYQDQSGALNEAMSDIFGEMIERYALGSNDWIIGTQITRADLRRSFIQPELHDQPSKMSNFVVTDQDNGGVHINSGIINRAFYLLAQSTGVADAERIFYRTLTQHLVARSDFIDARLAAIQSAKDLFGAASSQAAKTADAFDAVEIFDQAPPPAEPEIPAVASPDSTLFIYNDSAATFLGRRETALADPNQGARLSSIQSARSRPSVTGDGTVAFFTSAGRDGCFIRTDGGAAESCIGVPGQVSSSAMSPDGRKYAFVFMNASGNPTDTIRVIDIAAKTDRTFTLEVPLSDGESAATVAYADTMEFTADGDYLVYDAFTVTHFGDGTSTGSWAIYAVDVSNGEVIPLYGIPGAADIEYPALSSRSDRYLTFDVQTTDKSYVFLIDLETAEGGYIESSEYIGVPAYNGDDTAIIFSAKAATPSGRSIYRWGLSGDRVSPVGNASLWIADADHGTIYRRGAYSGPTTQPGSVQLSTSSQVAEEGAVVTLFIDRVGGNKGPASVAYRTNNGSATGGQDFFTHSGTVTWVDGDDDPKMIKIALMFDNSNEPTETFTVSLSSPSGVSLGSVTSTTIAIENKPAPSNPTRRRPVRRG